MTSEPPRILHVIENLGLGGAERLLVTLLPELLNRGFAPEVAVLGRRLDLATALESAGVPVHALRLHCHRHPVAASRRLRDVVRGRGVSLIHTHLAHANLYGRVAARLTGVPVVTTYHDTDYEPEVLLENPDMTRWKQAAYRTADRVTARRLVAAAAVSQYVARSIERHLRLPSERIEVIYNGVPPTQLEGPGPEQRAERRQSLSVPPRARIVVQVGRLTPQKGPFHTLRAAELLRDAPDLAWWIVGEGPLREPLEREITRSGLPDRVRLFGGQADVRPFLEAADVFVFPSLHEGLGIAVLEAMAAGLPVVAYRSGPLPEVVVDGETGLLVPTGDAVALAAAVRRLVEDPEHARAMGRSGRMRVRQAFRIDQSAERHAAWYRRILARVGEAG